MQRSVPAAALLLVALVLVLLSAPSSSGRTWCIKADGTGDAPTIQAGVDSSAAGDTVLVASGHYFDCTHVDAGGTLNCAIIEKAIVVQGEAGPEATTIDATDSGRVPLCRAPAIVDGFRITGGRADRGGGAYLRQATMSDCIVTGNHAFSAGGGILLYGDPGEAVKDCRIVANSAGRGAAICGEFGHIWLSGCLIMRNIASPAWCGAICADWVYGTALIEDCVISDNQCSGLYIAEMHTDQTFHIRRCTFADNQEYQALILSGALTSCYISQTVFVGGVGCGEVFVRNEHVNSYMGGDWSWCNTQWITPNLSADPLFCAPLNGDYSLAANSPCLPENNQWGVLIGALGEGCGPIARLQESWAKIKARYR